MHAALLSEVFWCMERVRQSIYDSENGRKPEGPELTMQWKRIEMRLMYGADSILLKERQMSPEWPLHTADIWIP